MIQMNNMEDTSQRFTDALYDWPLNHPWWMLLFAALLVAMLVPGLTRITSTSDYRVYFGPDNPELKAFDATTDQFELGETLIIGVEARLGDMFTAEHLQALREFTERAWLLPYAQRADSLSNFQLAHSVEDDIFVNNLVPEGLLGDEKRQSIRDYALASDDLLNRYISPDGSVASVMVLTPLPRENLEEEVPRLADALRALISEFEARYPSLTYYASGVIMLNDAMSQTMRLDLKKLYPLVYLIIFIGLLLYFRSLAPVLLTLLIVLLSATSAYATAGWLGIVLTTATMASGLVITTLAVADCVHILVSWQARINGGDDKREAMSYSLRINALPVFLTSVTTAVGFVSLEFADSPPFRDLGNIVAVGVLMALLLSLFTLPALVMLLPVKIKARTKPVKWPGALAAFTVRRRNTLLVAGLVVIIALSSGIALNRFGDNPAEYFDEKIVFRKDTDFLNNRLVGMQLVQFVLSAENSGGVNDPAYLQRVEAFTEWLQVQPEVRKVVSVMDLHKRLNRTMHGDDPDWYRLPDDRELAAQYLLFYELSLPQGLSLNNLIDADRQHSLMRVFMKSIESNRIAEFNQRAVAWLDENQPDWFFSQTGGTSAQIMFAGIAKRNFISMLTGLAVAIVIIVLLMMTMMRSVGIGLVSIVPNLVPGMMAFGLWGYLVGKVGISLAVVGSITLGIVVDDSIHFLSKYLRARREYNANPADSVRYAFEMVGPALVLTSVILTIGFLIISLSSFQLTAYMGLLTAITIALAIVADFLFLPPLLLLFDRNIRSSQ